MKITRFVIFTLVAAALAGASRAAAQEPSFGGETASLTMRSVQFDDQLYDSWLAGRRQESRHDPENLNLNCKEQPGAKLCLRLRQLDETVFGSCSGEYCTMIWEKGSSYLREISLTYEDLTIASAAKDIGELTRKSVAEMCRTSFTAGGSAASQQAMRRLVMSFNLAMPIFVDIQTLAGIEKPSKCTFKVE